MSSRFPIIRISILLCLWAYIAPSVSADTQNCTSSPAGCTLHQPVSIDCLPKSPLANDYILWTFGNGLPGKADYQLDGPHSAEQNPMNPDEILVAEEANRDVVVINKRTQTLRIVFGERGKPGGSGKLLNTPVAAHYLPAGPYQGHVIIAEYADRHRLLIVHYETGEVLWRYDDLAHPLDAIYWDDEHILASDADNGIFKIRLSDKQKVWDYNPEPHGNPFYLQKLNRPGVDSYGGDLLVSFWGLNSHVEEIRTEDKQVIWTYGTNQKHGLGDVFDKLKTPPRAFRYGTQVDGAGAAFTIICDERSRILCVNKFKQTVWELGGTNSIGPITQAPISPYCILPTFVTNTQSGTLLVTDWGLNMVLEINPFCIPPRMFKDAYLFKDDQTTNQFEDSAIIESRGYSQKNIQIINTHDIASLTWQVLASNDGCIWSTIHTPSTELAPKGNDYFITDQPWNFIKTQVKSSTNDNPATVDVLAYLQR